jgi:hypothetical protein
MKSPRVVHIVLTLIALGAAFALGSCSNSSDTPTTPSSAPVSALEVTGATPLTVIGQTVQLKATATLSDGTSQNVTTTATWRSSDAGVATVSSAGVVRALSSGVATITATYQGKTATTAVPTSTGPSTNSVMTATIDGAPFSAATVSVIMSPNPGVPSGQLLGISGTSGFTVPFQILEIAVPAAIGTYEFGPSAIPNGSFHLQPSGTASMIWDTLQVGASGTVTTTLVTLNAVAGTFSITLRPLTPTGATGTKLVTDGAFSVTF